jgi:serine/threonine-protein kinase
MPLSPEDEKHLQELLEKGETTEEEVRETKRLLEQARRVGWTLSVSDALVRAGASLAEAHHGSDAFSRLSEKGSDPLPPQMPSDLIDAADLRLLEKIGRGSQAVVYKCRQVSTGRVLAVKILSAESARDPQVRNRFINEGRQAARLVHPNIVRIFQVAPFKETFFIAMEYMDGGSVADLLAVRKRFDPAEAITIIRAAAEGLAYAHRQGFIHRDIKPRNILLTKEGVVKIADMGLARRNADLDAAFQEVGKAYGTPYYISPEQVRGDPDTDHRTDIYSLGATFYEMLAGRPPFVAPNSQQIVKIMQMHLYKPVPDPRNLAPDLPESLCRILAGTLAKRPADRYKTAEAFIAALDRTGLATPHE